MKKTLLISTFVFLCIFALRAQNKKDGTPDMRYKANKEAYGGGYSNPSYSSPSYSTPSQSYPSYSSPSYSTPNQSNPSYTAPKQERNYDNGGQYKLQNGYLKDNGTYVNPHLKTTPDNNKWNNINPK
jgi:hypothetical protein